MRNMTMMWSPILHHSIHAFAPGLDVESEHASMRTVRVLLPLPKRVACDLLNRITHL